VDADDGLTMRREFRPVRSAGLYVPGGSAAYPSTVLMLALPARAAGVERLVLATPPGLKGDLPPALLHAAWLAGVTEVYRVGGAQAIAALAYGTESIHPVEVVAGPGNRFVTAAKRIVFGTVGIDGLAGPSEIALVADGSTPPRWAALDVLAQLEHDPDARALVATPDAGWLERMAEELSAAAAASPRRAVLSASIAASAGVVLPDMELAARAAGAWAAEHLSILAKDPEHLLAWAEPAGAVFLGPFAPVAIGDYLAGPNHTLPTGGTARFLSGLGVDVFGRRVAVVGGDAAALAPLLEPAAALAEAEGLPGHALSLRARRNGADAWPGVGTMSASSAAGSAPVPTGPAAASDGAAGTTRAESARGSGPRLSRRARTFEPYRAARHHAASGILLDANENPLGGFERPPALAAELAGLGRYPDPSNARLRGAAARAFGVTPESVFAGNGSDEAIDLLVRAFVDPGDEVLVASPTYGMYAVQAALHGASVRELPLAADFRLDASLLERAAGRARLAFLCSPNNPTGNLLGRASILEAARRFGGLVVVDEAYVEFAGAPSLATEAARPGSSLVVLRTLSKAWGLAGLRVGFAVAEPGVVGALQRVKLPYNLSAIACALAIRALSEPARLERAVRANAAERSRLEAGLVELGLAPLPSAANFLLVPHARAPELVRRLEREGGVVVRDRSGIPRLPSAFRVSVGTTHENAAFLRELARCLV
jgi:histidinol dehydrogenase